MTIHRLWLIVALIIVALCGTYITLANAALSRPDQLTGYNQLAPLENHPNTAIAIVRRLTKIHYHKRPFNDTLSSEVYDRFLEDLDNSRLYFYDSDIKLFEAYRYQLDDLYPKGQLNHSFTIFNRYQQRLIERLKAIIADLENGVSDIRFDVEEYIETDRENSPWPKSQQAMQALWDKRLKNSLLSLKLAGKTLEEARTTLLKRYSSQLNRAYQTNSEDAFQYIMNALTRSYDPHTQYFSPRISENFNINKVNILNKA